MAVPLTREERTEYDATEGRIVAARRQLKQIKGIPHEPFGDFLAAVHHLAANDAGPDGRAANEYLNAFSSRREIVATSSAKYEALGKFAEAIRSADGALLFTETVRAANHAIVRLDPVINIEIITGDTGRSDRGAILDAFGRSKCLAKRISKRGALVDAPAEGRQVRLQRVPRVAQCAFELAAAVASLASA